MEKSYVIRNKRTHLYWNNNTGWGDKQSVDIYTNTEKYRLPIDGYWVKNTKSQGYYLCRKRPLHLKH